MIRDTSRGVRVGSERRASSTRRVAPVVERRLVGISQPVPRTGNGSPSASASRWTVRRLGMCRLAIRREIDEGETPARIAK